MESTLSSMAKTKTKYICQLYSFNWKWKVHIPHLPSILKINMTFVLNVVKLDFRNQTMISYIKIAYHLPFVSSKSRPKNTHHMNNVLQILFRTSWIECVIEAYFWMFSQQGFWQFLFIFPFCVPQSDPWPQWSHCWHQEGGLRSSGVLEAVRWISSTSFLVLGPVFK